MPGEKQHPADSAGFDQLAAQGRTLSEVLARLTAGRDQLAAAVRDIEGGAQLLAARQDTQFAELRQALDQAELERRQAEAENRACGEQAAKQAEEALARSDEGLRRIEALAAATEAGDASTAEVLGRLSASWHTMINAVRGIEQRVEEFVTRQDSQRTELRQLLRQVEIERRRAEAETRACGEQATKRASEALARGDEALRRIEALTTASQARAANTTELLGRLAADWDTLIGSVRGIEQRVAEFAARQDSQLGGLRQLLDQVEVERRQTEAETRTGDERATTCASEALARGDDALRRIEALAAASQTRAASATDLLGRLAADWDTLISSVRGIEQRVADSAAQLSPEKRAPAGDESASTSPPAESTLDEPSKGDDADVVVLSRRNAVAAWLALMAPGILLTQALLVLALAAAPWLTTSVYVAPGASLTAAALLLAQSITAVFMLRSGSWLAAVAFMIVLIVEALGAGALLGLDLQPRSPAIAMCLATLVMSAMAGGWLGGFASLLAAAAGVGAAMHAGLAELLLRSGTLLFSTTLSAGTSFATAPPLATTAVSFPTVLSVETFYDGSPVVVGSSAQLFLPALAIVLLALLIGGGLNVLRGRRAMAAVAAAIVAAHRTAGQG
jgi:hypothetical protein